jgi:hypothetical protein
MNTSNNALAENETFSVAELEARFEMQAVPSGVNPINPDWKCGCTFEF